MLLYKRTLFKYLIACDTSEYILFFHNNNIYLYNKF